METPKRHANEDTAVTEEDIAALTSEVQILGDSKEALHDMAARLLEENVPTAVLSLVKLAKHSHDEKMRFQAAKYIVERVLGPANLQSGTDKPAWEKLLEATEKRHVESTTKAK